MARKTKFTVEYLDDGPDDRGRRTYFLHWEADRVPSEYRPQPHPADGEPVGYRRAQIFHTDRAPPPGAVVVNARTG